MLELKEIKIRIKVSNLFLDFSIPELHNKVSKSAISFKDMAEMTIKVIDEKEPKVRALVSYDNKKFLLDSGVAWSEYKSRGSLLGLDGIPFGVKDIFNTNFYPTQMGSELWKDFTPGNNARVVDSLLLAGGVLSCKTVTAEFAVHALNETINPHDATKTPGTSSSGSAAAVATGMVPYALATQTAGSIIRPASFCGVWGMKPSFGMIPRTGVLKTTDTLDTIGFIAAHGKSLKPILDEIRVKGPNYPFVYKNVDSYEMADKKNSKKRVIRVGFIKTHVWDNAKDYVKEAVLGLVNRIGIEDGYEIQEIEWPSILNSSHKVHDTIYSKSLSYYFSNESKYHKSISPHMNKIIENGFLISPESFRDALIKQSDYCQIIDKLLSSFDFVLSIGTSSSAPLREEKELDDPSLIWTLGHLPSIGVPAFRCPQGMPFGVQFVGKKWSDYKLIDGIEELISRGILPSGSQSIL
jgi:Asp-tRNA(Asn)/Glu-tRNA(Gln) amidotransferase A subunit family amidase